ncbi:hypothetical protein [Siminovitchia fordii]|uniref:Uncharacterized protein n=1 Tax=Siminovitchia fordii TaxID=254759 RepID=A0ABQ4KAC0_9BACI|nr:hypothetical protein [Siminovitchia fordii]GIN22556.1 hypothetical protein J1TS3_36900 [Siminovitchia fordii]
MNVGEVIIKNGNADVIVEIRSDGGRVVIPLEQYIARNTVVNIDGEYKTIEEILAQRSEDYMNGIKVHER